MIEGLIMMCSKDTESDCLSTGLFGGPFNTLKQLEKVSQDTVIFLYNYSTQMLHGTWQRNGPSRWDPSSEAFGGLFPAHLPVQRVLQHLPLPLHDVAKALGCEAYLRFNRELTAREVAALLATMEQRAGKVGSWKGVARTSSGKLRVADARAVVVTMQQSCKAASQEPQQQEPIPGKIALVNARLSAASALAAMQRPDNACLAGVAAALQQAAASLEEIRALQAAQPTRAAALRTTHRISSHAAVSEPPAQRPLPEQRQPSADSFEPIDMGGGPSSLHAWFPPLSPAPPTSKAAKAASQAAPLGPSRLGGSGGACPGAAAAADPLPAGAGRVSKWSPLPLPAEQRPLLAGEGRTSLARLLDDVLEEVLSPAAPSSGKRAKKRRRLAAAPATFAAVKTLQQRGSPVAASPDAAAKSAAQPSEAPSAGQEVPPAAADRQASVGDAHSEVELTPLGSGGVQQRGGGSNEARAVQQPEQPAGLPAADRQAKGTCHPDGVRNSEERSSPDGAFRDSQPSGSPDSTLAPAAAIISEGQVQPPPPGALLCSCSGGAEVDVRLETHSFLLPRSASCEHVRAGLPVFLVNEESQLVVGPYYARDAAVAGKQVHVEEREPPLVISEAHLAECMPIPLRHMRERGPLLSASDAQSLRAAFADAAIPRQSQPYRMLGAELGGAVFACSRQTVTECLRLGVFGIQQNAFVPIVQHVRPGMPVFLLNASRRVLLGPFLATSWGGLGLEPHAWARPHHRTPFPAQVRVKPSGPMVTLAEKEFKPHLGYYSSSCFHFDLTAEEAAALLALFQSRQSAAADLVHTQHPADVQPSADVQPAQLQGVHGAVPSAPELAGTGPAACSAASAPEAAVVPQAQASRQLEAGSAVAPATRPAEDAGTLSGRASASPSKLATGGGVLPAAPLPAAPPAPAAAAVAAAKGMSFPVPLSGTSPSAIDGVPLAAPLPAAPPQAAAAAVMAASGVSFPFPLSGAPPSASTAQPAPQPLLPVFCMPSSSGQPAASSLPSRTAATPTPRPASALRQAPSLYSPTRAAPTPGAAFPFGQSTRPGLVLPTPASLPGQRPEALPAAAAQVPFPGFAAAVPRSPAQEPPASQTQLRTESELRPHLQQPASAALPLWAGSASAAMASRQQAALHRQPQLAAPSQLPEPSLPSCQAPPAAAAVVPSAVLPPWQGEPLPASLPAQQRSPPWLLQPSATVPANKPTPPPWQKQAGPTSAASENQLRPPTPHVAAPVLAGVLPRPAMPPCHAPAAGPAPSGQQQAEPPPPAPPPCHKLHPDAGVGLHLPDLQALAGAAAAHELLPDQQAVLAHALRDALEARAALHRALRVIGSVASLPPASQPSSSGAGLQPMQLGPLGPSPEGGSGIFAQPPQQATAQAPRPFGSYAFPVAATAHLRPAGLAAPVLQGSHLPRPGQAPLLEQRAPQWTQPPAQPPAPSCPPAASAPADHGPAPAASLPDSTAPVAASPPSSAALLPEQFRFLRAPPRATAATRRPAPAALRGALDTEPVYSTLQRNPLGLLASSEELAAATPAGMDPAQEAWEGNGPSGKTSSSKQQADVPEEPFVFSSDADTLAQSSLLAPGATPASLRKLLKVVAKSPRHLTPYQHAQLRVLIKAAVQAAQGSTAPPSEAGAGAGGNARTDAAAVADPQPPAAQPQQAAGKDEASAPEFLPLEEGGGEEAVPPEPAPAAQAGSAGCVRANAGPLRKKLRRKLASLEVAAEATVRKRKRALADDSLQPSTYVAFDTCVYMGKDRLTVIDCMEAWRHLVPPLHVLVPHVVVHELSRLCTDPRLKTPAMLGQLVLSAVMDSPVCRMQTLDERPAGRVRIKDDGILDCLLHFAGQGHNVVLCTLDKDFALRAQAQGIQAIKPQSLNSCEQTCLQVPASSVPASKRWKKSRK